MEKYIYYLTVIDSSSSASEANSVNIKKQIVITSEKRLKHTDIRKISNYIISYTSAPIGLCPDVPIPSFEGDVIAYFKYDKDTEFKMHITIKKESNTATAEYRIINSGETIQGRFNTLLSYEDKFWDEVIYSCYNMNEVSENVLIINMKKDIKYRYEPMDFIFSLYGSGSTIDLEISHNDTNSYIQKLFYMIDLSKHSVYVYTKNDKLYTNALIGEGIYMRILENNDSSKVYGNIKLWEREMTEVEQDPYTIKPRKTLIMFEGIDGSGKTTLKNNFENYLKKRIDQYDNDYDQTIDNLNNTSRIIHERFKNTDYNYMSISPLKEIIPGMKELLENKDDIQQEIRKILIRSKYISGECELVEKDGLFDELDKIDESYKYNIVVMDRFFNSLVYNIDETEEFEFETVTDYIKDKLINEYGYRLLTVYCDCPANNAYERISKRNQEKEIFEDIEQLNMIERRYNLFLGDVYNKNNEIGRTSKFNDDDILVKIPTHLFTMKESLGFLLHLLENLDLLNNL